MKKYKVEYTIERYYGADDEGSYEVSYPKHMSKEEVFKIEQERNKSMLSHNYDTLGMNVKEVVEPKENTPPIYTEVKKYNKALEELSFEKPPTLLERREAKLREIEEAKKKAKDAEEQKRKDIADLIINTLADPEIRKIAEDRLVERGNVCIHVHKCLCTDGFCDWQKGYHKYLKEFEAEWATQGVEFRYDSEGINMYFKGKPSYASDKYDIREKKFIRRR